MSQHHQFVIDNLRAENKMLRMELAKIQQSQFEMNTVERLMLAALTGAAARMTEKDAMDYAFKCSDIFMERMRETGNGTNNVSDNSTPA